MALEQRTDGREVAGDIEFTMRDEQRGVVHVRVSKEALEDFAHPRGVVGPPEELFTFALEEVLEAAERVYKRDRTKPRNIIIKSADLNL